MEQKSVPVYLEQVTKTFLDPKTKAEIHQLFFDHRRDYGQTIVIVTHDPDLAGMCDRSLFMRDGQFVDE